CGDAEERVAVLPRVRFDRRRLGDHIERCVPQPRTVVRRAPAKGEAQERIRAPQAELPHDLLQQWAAPRRSPHDHLPAPLDAKARIEQKLRVAFNTRIGHSPLISIYEGSREMRLLKTRAQLRRFVRKAPQTGHAVALPAKCDSGSVQAPASERRLSAC